MGDVEAKIQLEPVLEPSTSGRVAPFALYFHSGFSPSKDTSCKWEVQATDAQVADHYIIGRMVGSFPLPSSSTPFRSTMSYLRNLHKAQEILISSAGV